MPITPTSPIIVPGVTLDKFWLQKLVVESLEIAAENALPVKDARAIIELIPYNSQSLHAVPEKVVRVFISDIFSRVAQGDSDLEEILDLILAYAQKEARTKGLI